MVGEKEGLAVEEKQEGKKVVVGLGEEEEQED